MRHSFTLTILLALTLLAAACSQAGSAHAYSDGGDTLTSRARILTLVDHGSYVQADVADPWHDGRVLASYVLLPRDSALPDAMPPRATVVRVPLQRSVVYAGVHTLAIGELGAISRIAAVADGEWLPASDPAAPLLASGQITDIGSSMSPLIETVVDLQPDAILLSPYESMSRGGIETAGAPLVEMADYMELTPLGRAEWLLLLGYLYGCPSLAHTLYDSIAGAYESLCESVARVETRPRVLTERLTSGVWYVPGGQSYMARMIADAGGDYLWADRNETGSIPLDEAAVIDRAAEADIWLLKDGRDISRDVIAADVPHADAIKAWPAGTWVCNTIATPFFNDIAFHPERVLAEYIGIFHPEISGDTQLRYFKPIQ